MSPNTSLRGCALLTQHFSNVLGFVLTMLLSAGVVFGQDNPTGKLNDAKFNDAKATEQKATLPQSVPAAEVTPLPQKEIYRRLLRSTAYILTLDKEGKPQSSGSGWLLDKDRKLLVTNHHVIESLRTLRVYFPRYVNDRPITEKEAYWKSEGIPAEILLADVKKDLAVLKLAEVPPTAEPAVLADESPSPGELVYSIGSPGTSAALWIFTTGTVRSVHHVSNEDFDGTIIETQSPTNPGDSGGPAVNDRLQLVGVVFSHSVAARLSSNFVDLSEVKKFVTRANRLYDPKTADLFVERGINARENKRLDVAISDFTAALKLQPKNASAFTRRADCFREQRDYQTALSDYNDAIAADPNLSSAFTGRALVYRAQGKYEAAIADATTGIRLRPDYYHPSFVRGLVYLDNQDASSALPDFDRALKLAEKSPAAKHQTLNDRARAHEMKQDYKAAFDDYLAAMDIKPSDLSVYRRLADMLLDKADDPQTAFRVANAVLRNQPTYFHALIHRGRASIALKNYEDGLRDFSAAVRVAQGSSETCLAHLQRGKFYDQRDDKKAAVADYLSAIEANIDDNRAYNQLGDLLLNKAKEPPTAVSLFTEVIKQRPKALHAYLQRARAYRAMDELDQAIVDVDAAIRLNPKLAFIHDYRGDINLLRRDNDAAIRDYKAAIQINNKLPLYHFDLGKALATKGDHSAAIQAFDAALQRNPKYTAAYVERAISNFRQGDLAKSQADMKSAGELDPKYQGQELKLRYSSYLSVANATNEPLQIFIQYYTPTTTGEFRWYPTEPGPNSDQLRPQMEPGGRYFIVDNQYQHTKVKGARFRIWARGLNSEREYNAFRDVDLVAAPSEGYVAPDYRTYEYTFK